MDLESILISHSLKKSAAQLAVQQVKKREKIVQELLRNPRLPPEGLDASTVQSILSLISTMDSNNFDQISGMGEREGRIYSQLVRSRHFG